MIWATVSSRSCFCWLYRSSLSLAAKNIINLILIFSIWLTVTKIMVIFNTLIFWTFIWVESDLHTTFAILENMTLTIYLNWWILHIYVFFSLLISIFSFQFKNFFLHFFCKLHLQVLSVCLGISLSLFQFWRHFCWA